MLSKGDKEYLEQMVDEKIRKALTVTCRFEQRRDEKTGQPLAIPIIENRDVYLPAHWIEMLPYLEGSLRGVQETTDLVKNSVAGQKVLIDNMAGILIQSEESMKALLQLASRAKELSAANIKELGE
jgi:hypothetical protein